MAIINVDQFQDNAGDAYAIQYDTVTGQFTVSFTSGGSGGSQQRTVSQAERGHADGDNIGTYPSGNTLYKFYSLVSDPFATVTTSPYTPPPPPVTCDLTIQGVTTTNETDAGKKDGTVTVSASSSAGGIQYSLDNNTFQAGNQFTALAPGNYIIYVTDANGCTAQSNFAIGAYSNPITQFSDGLPVVTVSPGNVSRWNAVSNPIVITYQRKDYGVVSVQQVGSNANEYNVTLNAALLPGQSAFALQNKVYIKTSLYEYYGIPIAHAIVNGQSVFTIADLFVGNDTSAGGFLNVNNAKSGFTVETVITYGVNVLRQQTITAKHSPDYRGITRADLAPFLQTLLSAEDAYNYADASYTDINLAASFTIKYRETWQNGNGNYYAAPYPLYATYAAFQLQEQYGGNMAQYVPFLTTTSDSQKALFLTDWQSPIKYKGLPFEISFIYSENVINQQLYLELIPDCGTEQDSLLLNADASYLLNADASRFVIQQLYNPAVQGYSVIQALGVTRCLIPDFDCCATKITARVYYLNGTTRMYVTQPLVIRYQCPCATDPGLYMKWLNSKGAWDYYRFGFNQTSSSNINNDNAVTRFVSDWQNGQTIQDMVGKSSVPQVDVGADNLSRADAQTLLWMRKSIRVQMLTGTNPVRWQTVVLKDGSTDVIQTRKALASFRATLNLRSDNIQIQ